jgi:hypothetical protein
VPSIYEEVIQYQHKGMQHVAVTKNIVHHNWLPSMFQTDAVIWGDKKWKEQQQLKDH